MKTLLLLLPSLLAAAPDAEAQPSPATERPLPQLKQAPKVDGSVSEWARPAQRWMLGAAGSHGTPPEAMSPQAAWHRDVLYLGVRVSDREPASGDEAMVSISAPDVGPLAAGHNFRLSRQGLRRDDMTPAFAQDLVRVASRQDAALLDFELAVPARALPRFAASGPLHLDVCIGYADQDAPGGSAASPWSCPAGPSHRLTLPPAFRTALGLRPPKAVTALEPAATGWLGYSDAPHPVWVRADSPLTRDSLQTLFAPDLDPQSAALKAPLPPWVTLSDGRRVLLVLSGRSPFREEGACSPGTEARLGLFLVDKSGRAATRVLDWSAANCELGRVLSVALDDENALEVGYSSGAQVRFVWVGDHFERTDIG